MNLKNMFIRGVAGTLELKIYFTNI